jgi:hypothetical protein
LIDLCLVFAYWCGGSLGQQSVEIRAQDANAARSDSHGTELSAVDPVSDRLFVEFQLLGDLSDRQVLVCFGRIHGN